MCNPTGHEGIEHVKYGYWNSKLARHLPSEDKSPRVKKNPRFGIESGYYLAPFTTQYMFLQNCTARDPQFL